MRSLACVTSKTTRLRPGRWREQIQTVERFHNVPKPTDGTGAHPACYSVGTGAPHPGVNITQRDVGHSPATTAAFKHEWSQNPHLAILEHENFCIKFLFTVYNIFGLSYWSIILSCTFITYELKNSLYVHFFKMLDLVQRMISTIVNS